MMKKLKIIRSGETKIDAKLPVLSELEYEDEKIKNLLSKKIENPELSEREKKILEISKQEKISETLDDIKEYFSERERTICPYCFQPVGKDYIKELSNHIEKILNIEVQEHKSELDTLKSKLLPIEIDFSKFTKLSDEKIKECEENLIKYNSTIEEIKGYIEKKQKNLYIPIQNTNFEIDSKYNNCKDSLKKLEESIKEFNSNISNEDIVKENLINLNNQIAHYEIFYMNQQREKQENEKAEIQKKLENLAVEEEGLKSKIDSLKEQKKNIKIAMESINNDLKYIFFSKDRLKIEYENINDRYIVYSNNKKVNPDRVSTGERNAIALCYFFNQIMKNKNEEEIYKNEYLIVIDDPVSSFDEENRIGIISYLKYKIREYIEGNINTKIIILTHNLKTALDIKKGFDEMMKKGKKGEKKEKNKTRTLELSNKGITNIDFEKRNEYTFLLSKIFEYADNINEEYSHNIGNMMRRVIEAFGTFVYKKGVTEILEDEQIISKEEKEDIKFKNYSFKLLLNNSSHMNIGTTIVDNPDTFDIYSDEEKQITAKKLIILIYKLNPLHIKAHLGENNDVEEKIKKWIKESK